MSRLSQPRVPDLFGCPVGEAGWREITGGERSTEVGVAPLNVPLAVGAEVVECAGLVGDRRRCSADRARGVRIGPGGQRVRSPVEFSCVEHLLFDACSPDDRLDELAADLAEFVAVVGLVDEVALQLPEVLVELARIGVAEPPAQLGERDSVVLRVWFVRLPQRQQNRQARLVTQDLKCLDGPRARGRSSGESVAVSLVIGNNTHDQPIKRRINCCIRALYATASPKPITG